VGRFRASPRGPPVHVPALHNAPGTTFPAPGKTGLIGLPDFRPDFLMFEASPAGQAGRAVATGAEFRRQADGCGPWGRANGARAKERRWPGRAAARPGPYPAPVQLL